MRTEKELIEEIEFRVTDAIERNIQSRDGKTPPDAPAYGELWPWVVGKIRSMASERRLLFSMKADIAFIWLNEENEVKHGVVVYTENGYPVSTEGLNVDITHPTLGVAVRDIFKKYPIEEGVKILNEAVAPTRADKTRRIFAQACYLSDFENSPIIEKDKPLAEQRIYKPRSEEELEEFCGYNYVLYHSKPRRFDMYPLPPTMRGFLLMSKDRFVSWLREVTWPSR